MILEDQKWDKNITWKQNLPTQLFSFSGYYNINSNNKSIPNKNPFFKFIWGESVKCTYQKKKKSWWNC